MKFLGNISLLINPTTNQNSGTIVGGQPLVPASENQEGTDNSLDGQASTLQPQPQPQPNSGLFGFSITTWIIIIVAYFAVYYFVAIRPQRAKAKKMQEMQVGLSVGEDVVTSTGFYGRIVDVTDETFIVEFGTNKGVRIPVKKSEVHRAKAQDEKPVEKDK